MKSNGRTVMASASRWAPCSSSPGVGHCLRRWPRRGRAVLRATCSSATPPGTRASATLPDASPPSRRSACRRHAGACRGALHSWRSRTLPTRPGSWPRSMACCCSIVRCGRRWRVRDRAGKGDRLKLSSAGLASAARATPAAAWPVGINRDRVDWGLLDERSTRRRGAGERGICRVEQDFDRPCEVPHGRAVDAHRAARQLGD